LLILIKESTKEIVRDFVFSNNHFSDHLAAISAVIFLQSNIDSLVLRDGICRAFDRKLYPRQFFDANIHFPIT
jgi:hypothetical protein